MANYPVKWYSKEMEGAPSLPTGTTYDGSWVPFWKALLVEGFGNTVLDALEWDATAGWAKATINAGHTFQKDQIIEILDANEVEYLGEHRVKQVGLNEVWFELDATPSGNASGTITMKTPGLGWSIAAEAPDGNSIIFEAGGDEGNVLWRVFQDPSYFGSYQWLGGVGMVENVVAHDIYDVIYEHRWPASTRYSAAHLWDLVGDDKFFWWFPSYAEYDGYGAFCAGYINSIRPGDRYHFVMNYMRSTDPNSNSYNWGQYNYEKRTELLKFNDTSERLIARKYHQQLGTSSWKCPGAFSIFGSGLPYPNPTDNGFYMDKSPIMCQESDGTFRGYMPGIINPMHRNEAYIRKNFDNLQSFPGKLIRFCVGSYEKSTTSSGSYWFERPRNTLAAFDISKDGWR